MPGRLLIAIVAVAALLVGGLVGALAGLNSSPGPSPLPRVAATNFPSADLKFIPGVKIPDLQQYGGSLTWKCTVDDPSGSKPAAPARHRLVCDFTRGDAWFVADFDDETHVRQVTMNCRSDPNACKTYMAGLVAQLYPGQADAAGHARSWVLQNFHRDTSTVSGGLYLELQIGPDQLYVANRA